MSHQPEFNFLGTDAADGHAAWVARRRAAAQDLARKLNLPLEREVEVWLRGGIRLRGRLRLREEFLLIEESRLRDLDLEVDRFSFKSAEIESCVRVD